jgi:hypothetical protein
VFDREGNFLRSWGEGAFPARARHAHRRRRHPLPAPTTAATSCASARRRQGAARDRRAGQARAVHERAAVHRCTHTALSPKGEIYVSDGYGNARSTSIRRRQAAQVVGRAGTDPGQFNSRTTSHRRGRLGLRRRSREPSRAGVRRQRQVRDAVDQPCTGPAAVLLPRARRRVPRSASSARACGETRHPNIGPRLSIVDATERRSRGSAAKPAGARDRENSSRPHGLAVRCARRHLRRRSQLHRVPAAISESRRDPFRMRSLQKLERSSPSG